MRGKTAFITGATAGIGAATAEELAARGCHLVIAGRRKERLESLRDKLEREHHIKVTAIAADLRNRAECEARVAEFSSVLSTVSILVNNAGLALGSEPVQSSQIDDWEAMVDTNVKGLLLITRLILPYLLQQPAAHIVNLGSVAGRWIYPGGGVYCATKFAVRALSEGLRLDLMGKNVRVTNIEPGMVETEFSEVRYRGDKDKAKAVYKGMTPLSARDIAETIAWCLERPAHVNIQELVIFPTDQAGVGPYVHRAT